MDEFTSIADNVKRVLDAAAEAAIRSGRRPEDVKVLAATKMNDSERVREAIRAGIRYAGENRVQELREKNEQGAYEGAELHFIGHLQTNKVKYLVGTCRLIQSVDSPELVDEISRRAAAKGLCQHILVEVNIGGEEAKSGVAPEKLDGLLAYISEKPGIYAQGLMTIPPISRNNREVCNYFDRMYQLFIDNKTKKYDNVSMCTLSMGMSADYRQAILSGADMVRVGSAIFGSRGY